MFKSQNPLNKSGFLYLLSLLESGKFSKSSLQTAFQAFLSQDFSGNSFGVNVFDDEIEEKRVHKKVKISRKRAQISGLISLIYLLPKSNEIFDLCSGNGAFSAELARNFTTSNVVGVDISPELMSKASLIYSALSNLSFQTRSIFDYEVIPDSKSKLVVSLHGCGGLIDRAIDIAVKSRADFVGVPCCYSLISSNNPSFSLPRSSALSDRVEKYLKILKITGGLEGLRQDAEPNTAGAVTDILRLLVNFDKLLYLQQNGYETAVVPITDRFFLSNSGRRHINTPHRYALVGVRER